jgi:ParB family chromosome partitioning protein
MAAEGRRKTLGRGLSALLGDDGADYAELDKVRTTKTVPVEFLHPGRYQPRHSVDDDQIKELAQSVREKGILQPILVRRHPDEANAFEIIAGERRWRAAQLAKVHEVPVVIKDLDDREALEIALVENLQRQDLTPLEEAEGYRRLMDEFAHSQEALGKALGKSRSHVANMMRLLGLPDEVKAMLDRGDLSAGHARALLNAGKPVALARRVVRRGLNVRQTEALAKGAKAKRAGAPAAAKDADTLALERDLSALLGLRADIRFRGGKGTLTLHYGSLEQLDDIIGRLSHAAEAHLPDPLDDIPIDGDPDLGASIEDTTDDRNVVNFSDPEDEAPATAAEAPRTTVEAPVPSDPAAEPAAADEDRGQSDDAIS